LFTNKLYVAQYTFLFFILFLVTLALIIMIPKVTFVLFEYYFAKGGEGMMYKRAPNKKAL